VLNGVIKDLNADNLAGKIYVSNTDKNPVDNKDVISEIKNITENINKQYYN
jgi:hypothetical protein